MVISNNINVISAFFNSNVRDLRLIGGIDLDALRKDKAAIRQEIEEKVPPLIAEGGFIPLADGRVRADVPFENYVYYRQLLEKVTKR